MGMMPYPYQLTLLPFAGGQPSPQIYPGAKCCVPGPRRLAALGERSDPKVISDHGPLASSSLQ